MAQKVEKNGNNSKKGGNEERKHMPLSLRMTLEKVDTFGKDGQHLWFTAKEPDSEVTLLMKVFNFTKKMYDTILDNDEATVYFDIARTKDNNGGYQTQLVAYDVVPINK